MSIVGVKLKQNILEVINKQATEICDELMKRFAKLEGITERLKAED